MAWMVGYMDGTGALPDAVTFEDFVRPLAVAGTPPPPGTPLGRVPAGDLAVLAWLDDLPVRLPARVEAEITAHWNTASLRDVHARIVAATEPSGATS
jgi:hypothetical protein